MNWAAPLVGSQYRSGACGPDRFNCIGLVRYNFRARHGVELPDYELESSSYEGLLKFIRATGWRPVKGRLAEDDIVTMDGLEGKHTGVMVRSCEGLQILHAQGNDKRGQVVAQPLNSLIGYRNIRIWRRACS